MWKRVGVAAAAAVSAFLEFAVIVAEAIMGPAPEIFVPRLFFTTGVSAILHLFAGVFCYARRDRKVSASIIAAFPAMLFMFLAAGSLTNHDVQSLKWLGFPLFIFGISYGFWTLGAAIRRRLDNAEN